MPNSRIYLDYAATSPLNEVAKQAFVNALDIVGNPSSLHQDGRNSRMKVEFAREKLAAACGAHASEIIFTSGGTEADNLGIKGLYWWQHKLSSKKNKILVPAFEHHAVLDCVTWLESAEGAELVFIPIDKSGMVDIDFIADYLKKDAESVALVTCMWANNEVGTIEPILEIAKICQHYEVLFHSDAVQAFGNIDIDFASSGLTSMAISSHKLGGPLGVGALVLARSAKPVPVMHGGGQEREVRSGTLDAPAIVAFAEAASDAAATREERTAKLTKLRDYFINEVEKIDGIKLSGHREKRLATNANFTFAGCEGDSLLFLLDLNGISTSTGSACTAGVPKPSHVLLAMGYSEEVARGVQRFTFSGATTKEDIDKVLAVLPNCYEQARAAGLAADVPSIQQNG
ncbi:MAG: cysteine desulfurase family protein [Micrococcaceae bacterium]